VSSGASASLAENAPAKVNLTLRVLGRRNDGYHEIESLVAFAEFGDRLHFSPGDGLALTVNGPMAEKAGDPDSNLVVKAAREMAARRNGLSLGAFRLDKRLPVAAGLGGGSADAAAALRLIARVNKLRPNDPALYAAARATGADVPVCFDPRPRFMRGIGEILSEQLTLPPLPAVLVNPGVAVATKDVFAGWASVSSELPSREPPALETVPTREKLLQFLLAQSNDLERPAIAIAPVIAEVLSELRLLPGCQFARMSGSGATCFGLFITASAAAEAAKALSRTYPQWWVCATTLCANS
jgi:4-diphosphocytidyl-2-C-methyl-D-erythritol kinase